MLLKVPSGSVCWCPSVAVAASRVFSFRCLTCPATVLKMSSDSIFRHKSTQNTPICVSGSPSLSSRCAATRLMTSAGKASLYHQRRQRSGLNVSMPIFKACGDSRYGIADKLAIVLEPLQRMSSNSIIWMVKLGHYSANGDLKRKTAESHQYSLMNIQILVPHACPDSIPRSLLQGPREVWLPPFPRLLGDCDQCI